ncbi:hypothetical protein THTE_0322 [Thermogutta terrifontis]|uniref:Uncharacterized protein n=1 Tax=Thermogutta terrifontis TaxID=1331910 RepID=A0A286RAB3_9BACT|nr:hypothetical protein THTE_0322 [Thermogutta terrifontis]
MQHGDLAGARVKVLASAERHEVTGRFPTRIVQRLRACSIAQERAGAITPRDRAFLER